MEISHINTIVSIIVAAVTGSVAALIAPWAKWGVEKRSKRLYWRKGIINECKKIINDPHFVYWSFVMTSNYLNLEPYLSEKLKKDIKKKYYAPGKILTPKQKKNVIYQEFRIKNNLLKEINLLEKKWGLI